MKRSVRVASVGLWVLVAGFALWAAIRLLGLERGFPMVQLFAFTPYVAFASVVPLIGAALTRRWVTAGAAAVVAVALVACVVPRWVRDDNAASGGGPTVRVLTSNLLGGGADARTVVNLVRELDVDVLALQEFTSGGQRALEDAGLAEELPNRVTYPLDGVVGSALYTRHPLRDGALRRHPRSGFAQARAEVTVPGAAPFEVESVHPCAPATPGMTPLWAADLADQPEATPGGRVRILAGDFNATLDHAPLRRLIDSGYRDAADVVGAGLDPTWPSDERWYVPGVALDRVLVDRRVGVGKVSIHGVPRSDHRAFFAELRLPAG